MFRIGPQEDVDNWYVYLGDFLKTHGQIPFFDLLYIEQNNYPRMKEAVNKNPFFFTAIYGTFTHIYKNTPNKLAALERIKGSNVPFFDKIISIWQFLFRVEYIITAEIIKNGFRGHVFKYNGTNDNDKLYYIPAILATIKELYTLDLKSNNISIIHFWEKEMRNLRILDLGHNNISSFAFVTDNFHHLRALDLSHNKLSQTIFNLPELPNLQSLNVSHNTRFRDISFNLYSSVPNLEKLYVDNCNIRRIRDGISQLGKLKVLSANDNNLDRLPIDIYKLKLLETLSCRNNKIKRIPINFHSVEHLNLSNNLIKEIPADTIFPQNIKTIILKGNKIESFRVNFSRLPNLRLVQISDTYLKEVEYGSVKILI